MLSSIFLFVSFCIVILCSDFFSLLRVCAREREREWECKTAYEMANGHLPHIVSASGSHCHLRSCYYHICHKLFSLAFTLRVRPKLHHFFRLFLIFFFPLRSHLEHFITERDLRGQEVEVSMWDLYHEDVSFHFCLLCACDCHGQEFLLVKGTKYGKPRTTH